MRRDQKDDEDNKLDIEQKMKIGVGVTYRNTRYPKF